MQVDSRCPRCGFANPTVAALNEALLTIGRERGIQATLRGLVDGVRRLANATSAALGIVGEDGTMTQLIASGMTEDALRSVGALPPARGLFRAILDEPLPLRIPDIADDPRAAGSPPALAAFGSFMGVPLVSGGRVLGAFFLLGRTAAPAFTAADQQAAQLLASHAVLALENARLYERSRELNIVEERNRLARELHDAVSQTLFSIVFTAKSALTLLERDVEAGRARVADLQRLAQTAQQEMRSLIFELRPADLEREGLVPTLTKHVDVLRRVHAVEIDLVVDGDGPLPPRTERELFRIAQEALGNALKHARAERVSLSLSAGDEGVRLVVTDDGRGFDPSESPDAERFGLTSMGERAEMLSGRLSIDSTPGRGTTICVEVPRE